MASRGWVATTAMSLTIVVVGCQSPNVIPSNARKVTGAMKGESLVYFPVDQNPAKKGDGKSSASQVTSAADSQARLSTNVRQASATIALTNEGGESNFTASSASVPLTLDNAIAVALDRNPNLLTLRAGDPVAQAAYKVSEVYPWNPFVQVQVLPYSRDNVGQNLGVNHYVWLMQTIELAHQSRHRKASAAAALNQVRWNIVQAELANAAQTQRLYFTALFQRESLELAQRAADLNDELLGVVERRFKAGLATATEQTMSKVAARQTRRQAELAEAGYRTAILALQRQLNLPADEPIELIGRLAEFTWLPVTGTVSAQTGDFDSVNLPNGLAAELAQHRPDVLAAQCGVSVAQANADLARANQCQNVGFGPFYERDESGTVFAGFRTQMNLPVWDNGKPLTAQREAEQNLQGITFDQLRSRAEIEAGTAIERYERARLILEKERANRRGDSLDELREIKDQFTSGQADILNVFNVQNTLMQEQTTYLGLLNEVAQSAADVTLMAGLPPARLVTANPVLAPKPEALPTP